MNEMRVVSPFRPFPPESDEHRALGPFDWVDALRMLAVSVERSCVCETLALTDVDTVLPVPALHYETTERRLMLWILDVSLRYLESTDFDRDTVFCSPDSLVFCDLRPFFAGEFGIVIRPDHGIRPILNALQWWPVQHQAALVALYQRAIKIAHTLPEHFLVWGADSKPFEKLLKPLYAGCGPRKHGVVANLIDSRHVMAPLTRDIMQIMDAGLDVVPPQAVVDFRYTRKLRMRDYFDATLGKAVAA